MLNSIAGVEIIIMMTLTVCAVSVFLIREIIGLKKDISENKNSERKK